MASWRDAVQAAPTGTRLLLEVAAGAKQARFPDGFNPWRGRIGIRVRAPAQGGRANQEVASVVAAFLGVPLSTVVLESGHLDSRKTLLVTGLSKADLESRLEGALQEEP